MGKHNRSGSRQTPAADKWEEVFGKVDLSRFTKEQQEELLRGAELDLPVQIFADPSLTPAQMHTLCSMLETMEYIRENPGERVVATEYGPEELTHGFRSETNFVRFPDRVCYVPENWDFDDGPGYTANDFLMLCDGDHVKAEIVFSLCDWQHPSTVLGEWDEDDELALQDLKSGIPQEPARKTLSQLIGSANEQQKKQAVRSDPFAPFIH